LIDDETCVAARSTYARNGLVAALDIGSTKTVCLIGRVEADALRIVGRDVRASRGLKAGAVVDLNDAVQSIGDCVSAAEEQAGVRVQSVLISVGCGSPCDVTAQTAMTIGGALVGDAHLSALLAEGHNRCQSEGLEVLQSEPAGYVVDDTRGVHDPSGMFCQQLGVSMHAVAVRIPPLTNLRLAVERCRLRVSAPIFSAYASGLAVLSADEKQLGATVIDMGGGTTSVAVFMDDHLAHVDVVPVGGQLVTADLARILSAPMTTAERIKVLYGAALGDLETGAADVVAVQQMGEEGEENAVRFPRSTLTRIIQVRLEEIFGEVQTRLRNSGFDVAAGRRAVLTGGCSQMAGVRELATRVLNKQVRIGKPLSAIGLPATMAGPEYSCVAGLVFAGATLPPERLNSENLRIPHETSTKSWFARLTGGLMG
jgi:cell division protein FtsA